MKKLGVMLGVLVAILLLSPLAMGFYIKHVTEQSLADFVEANPGVPFEIAEYDRGWFTTVARYTVDIALPADDVDTDYDDFDFDDEDSSADEVLTYRGSDEAARSITLTSRQRLHHGPFPWTALKDDSLPFRFGAGVTAYEFEIPAAAKQAVPALKALPNPKLYSYISLTGKMSLECDIPAGELAINSELAETPINVSWEPIECGGYSHLRNGAGESTVTWPGLRVTNDDAEFVADIGEIRVIASVDDALRALPLQDFEMLVDSVKVTMFDDPLMAISGLKMAGNIELDDDAPEDDREFVKGFFEYAADKVSFEDFIVKNAKIRVALDDFDRVASEAAQLRFKEIAAAAAAADQAGTEPLDIAALLWIDLEELLPVILEHGRVVVETIEASLPDGDLKASGEFAVNGFTPKLLNEFKQQEEPDIEQIMALLQANATVTIDEPLSAYGIDYMIDQQLMQLPDEMPEEQFVEFSAMIEEQMGGMLEGIIEQGLVQRKNVAGKTILTSKATFSNSQLKVNGEPMELPF